MINFLKHDISGNTFIKKTQKSLIAKEITFQDDNHAYQEHQNGDFIDDVHRLQIDIFRPIGVPFSEKIASYLTQTEEFAEPTLIFFFLLHTLKFFDEFGINPVTILFNKAYQFINGLFGRNVLLNHIFIPVEGYSARA